MKRILLVLGVFLLGCDSGERQPQTFVDAQGTPHVGVPMSAQGGGDGFLLGALSGWVGHGFFGGRSGSSSAVHHYHYDAPTGLSRSYVAPQPAPRTFSAPSYSRPSYSSFGSGSSSSFGSSYSRPSFGRR